VTQEPPQDNPIVVKSDNPRAAGGVWLGWSSTLLRLLHPSVLLRISHEAHSFLLAVHGQFFQEGLLSQASQANSALYANLAKVLVARFYGKSLIPQLGT